MCLDSLWDTSRVAHENRAEIERDRIFLVAGVQLEKIPEDEGNKGHAGAFIVLCYSFDLLKNSFLYMISK